mgnify:CR=1 FL=1
MSDNLDFLCHIERYIIENDLRGFIDEYGKKIISSVYANAMFF